MTAPPCIATDCTLEADIQHQIKTNKHTITTHTLETYHKLDKNYKIQYTHNPLSYEASSNYKYATHTKKHTNKDIHTTTAAMCMTILEKQED